jgi:type 1 glutamine amidotransferase
MTRFLHSSYDAFQSVKFLERPDLMAQYAFEQLMNFSMRALGFSCFAAVLPASADSGIGWVSYPGGDGPGKGKHVVLLAGDEEYRSEEALPMLAKVLSERHGFKCTVLFSVDPDGTINPNKGDSLGMPETLDSADSIVISLRFRKWSDAAMKHFDDAIQRGVPIVGLRTSTHAFQLPGGSAFKQYNNFGKDVLGEKWVSHWGHHNGEATRGIIEAAAAKHPLLNGVGDVFGDSDVYEAYPPADATILMRGQVLKGMSPTDPPAAREKQRATDKGTQDINTPMMPVAWVREVKNTSGKSNKVICTTMGAATDLASEGLRRFVVNGVFWGLDLQVPAKADVTPIGEFVPSKFKFNGFKPGVKVADHAL